MTTEKNRDQMFSVRQDTADGRCFLRLRGNWTLANAQVIDHQMQLLKSGDADTLDCSMIEDLDTTGSILVRRYATTLGGGEQIPLKGIRNRHSNLLTVINCCPPVVATHPDLLPWHRQILDDVGEATTHAVLSGANLLSFIGLVLIRLFGAFLHPGRLRFVPLVHQLEAVGFKALGIVGLISFLIGAVMVNQGAVQLAKFGADIFVIDMLGISHLRELGILLTAIIIAGRSGSAFTAQIGSMKLHEEIDAMRTLGMNPVDVLVLPRVMALVIALPLLTFYADVVGIAGGALMAWGQLGITPANFLFYFRDVMSIDHFLVGLIKAPFFAAVIAISGCYEGLKVARSADSLGAHTTRSVVQSIFLVITLDALFAIFFTAVDL